MKRITLCFALLPILLNSTLSASELMDLSIDELANIPVSIASRNELAAIDNAAAVTVISNRQIQLSGFTQIPDILKMVPGLHVGRVDSNKWWVSLRGFPGRFNGSLQVMIDGRNIFTPLFSGTYWEHHMPPVKDIDRIEVIRGPGGSIWGNNAVNGVINIITKDSNNTVGTYVSGLAGDHEIESQVHLRHGFKISNTSARVYAQQTNHGGGELADIEQVRTAGLRPGDDAGDDWTYQSVGFRTDTQLGDDVFNISGEVFNANYDQTRLTGFSGDVPVADVIDANGFYLRGKWEAVINTTDIISIESSFDNTKRQDGSLLEVRQSQSLTVQYEYNPKSVSSWVFGYNYSRSQDDTEQITVITFNPEDKTLDYNSVFIQNSYELMGGKTILTSGLRYDHNEYTGWEHQPSIRLLYKHSEQHRFWSSLSRAVDVPGRTDREFGQQFGDSFFLFGVQDQQPLTVVSAEGGYRYSRPDLYIDLALFFNEFDGIAQSDDDLQGQRADIFGLELSVNKQWVDGLSTTFQFAYHDNNDDDNSPNAFGLSGVQTIRRTAGLQVQWLVSENLSVNPAIYYNSNPQPEVDVDLYDDDLKVDLNLQYQVNPQLRFILGAQNLSDSADPQVNDSTRLNSAVKRTYFLKAEYDW